MLCCCTSKKKSASVQTRPQRFPFHGWQTQTHGSFVSCSAAQKPFWSRDGSCVSSDHSLRLVAAHSQINQYSVYNTCSYILGRRCSECGGGEANLVNWEQLGCWVTLEASGVSKFVYSPQVLLTGHRLKGWKRNWIFVSRAT